MFCGWVFTLLIGGAISAGIFAWGTYAPSKAYGGQILQYQRQMQYMTDAQLKALNASAQANPAGAPSEIATIGKGWSKLTKTTKDHVFPSTTVGPSEFIPYVNDTAQLYLDNSVVKFNP